MKLYIKIFFALIFVYIVLLASDKIYGFFLNENVYLKQVYIQKKKINADFLILGNCVPNKLINPSILEKITKHKTYNLAETHANLTENYLSFYVYLKSNKAPKRLFIYTTPESFDPSFNKFTSYRFAYLMHDNEVRKTIKISDLNYYRWTFIPFAKYRYYNSPLHYSALQGAMHYFANSKKRIVHNGYLNFEELHKYRSLYPNGYRFKWDNLQEKYLIKLIFLAKKHGTKVILFESPFYSRKNELPNRNEILQKIKVIADKTNVLFIKFDTLKFPKSNFANNDMLYTKNIEKFNILFARRVQL